MQHMFFNPFFEGNCQGTRYGSWRDNKSYIFKFCLFFFLLRGSKNIKLLLKLYDISFQNKLYLSHIILDQKTNNQINQNLEI